MDKICFYCKMKTIEDFDSHVESCSIEQLLAYEPYLDNLYNLNNPNWKIIIKPETNKNENIKQDNIKQDIIKPEIVVKPKQLTQNIKLTKCQVKALKFCIKRSKLMSKNTEHLLLEKIIKLGYGPSDYDILMKYVEDIDIMMFLPLFSKGLIHKFKEDCRLKNLFEVMYGMGGNCTSSRIIWENSLFNGFYDKSTAEEKVKYGCVNMDKNPLGVLSAKSYGDSFLVLKKEVKYRITLVYGDSAGISSKRHIATPKYMVNILNYIPDDLLSNMLMIANGKDADIKYTSYSYVEAQIHGELRLDRDVEKLIIFKGSIDKNDKDMADIKEMCTKYNIELIIR